MEKAKDYFINFVLFLIYFVIVFFALVFNNSLGWFLLAFFTLYVSWSVVFIKHLSKETFCYLHSPASRLS